jgi:signal peptidase
MKKKLTKILNMIVTVLIVCILIVSVFILTVSLTTRDENGGVPNVFGKAPISVLTDSMVGDDELDFSAGDLLICDAVPDDGTRTNATYSVGDVVTFQQDINGDDYLEYVTHRIYKVNDDGTYLTKGDNNDTYDQDSGNTTVFNPISSSDIVATYHGTKISGLGNVLSYLQTQMGFFLCVLLPMIIFFLYEAVRVVINIIAYNKEKAVEKAQAIIDSSVLTEDQKKRAIEEYLAAQNAATSEDTQPQSTDEEPESDDTPTEE